MLRKRISARYALIDELRLQYPVSALSRVLQVSSSGYYQWRKAPFSAWQREEFRLELKIRAAHRSTRETYGPERFREDLAAHGIEVGVHRIKRIRKKLSGKLNIERVILPMFKI